MSTISTYKETTHTIDADGVERSTTVEKTSKIERSTEPDYIKLYTRMWCEFNGIPIQYREFFLELATRMTYCNTTDLKNSQIVFVGSPVREAIMTKLHWKARSMYQRALKELCDCNAIKLVRRGVYQINPSYASKGEWKYNPRLQHGGVEDLIAVFHFKEGTVDTKITWADDGTASDLNDIYRKGLNVRPEDRTVLTHTTITPQPQEQSVPGQMVLSRDGSVHEEVPADMAALPF